MIKELKENTQYERNGWYKKDQIELQELKNKTSDVKIPLMALTAETSGARYVNLKNYQEKLFKMKHRENRDWKWGGGKGEQNLSDLWDSIKWSNECVIGVCEFGTGWVKYLKK